MAVRALVVCPETYEGSSLRDLPGSAVTGARFASWLSSHVEEPCSVTFLTNADRLPDELAAGAVSRERAELGPLSDLFLRPGSLDELGEEDAFVLYWLGHGAIGRENGRHRLYVSHKGYVELEDLQARMSGPGRPRRLLFVIDACREGDSGPGGDTGGQMLVTAVGAVPHPDWNGLVLYGARHGEQALFDEQGGVFTRRLVEAVRTLPRGDRLDLVPIERTAVELEARFRKAYEQDDPDYGQIPTHYWISRRGLMLVDKDFRPGVAVTPLQAERLRTLLSEARLTAQEEGEVGDWLHTHGPRMQDDDLPLPELAVRMTRLPHRADGSHCITGLCTVLARIGRLRDEIHDWYGSWAADKGLAPLTAGKVPATMARERAHHPPSRPQAHLVIDLERLDEITHGSAAVSGQDSLEPSYRAQAWFYTGPRRRRISVPQRTWHKDEFAALVAQVYDEAYAKVRSALHNAWVEFIVDRDLFGHRFDTIPSFTVPSGSAPLLGDKAPVVLRDRWRHRRGPQTLNWERLGTLLDSVPAARLNWQGCAVPCAPGDEPPAGRAHATDYVFTATGTTDACAGIVLSRPLEDRASSDIVGTALNNGAVLAIWTDRSAADDCARGGDGGALCDGALVRESLLRQLEGRPLRDVPDIVFGLRCKGGDEAEVFRDVVVLFDDPRRSPLVRTAVAMP
ncbi:caspase family protein [Streptomyces sp. NPDC058398]|uniref:caspase family protein n=1 Tax=Streptomyces sp. NPDC058398 TaxID=3346479 RepID=UPI003667530E